VPDTPEKRRREAQKVRNREVKAERKRLRKEGLLGQDTSGLFQPGERRRETVDAPGSFKAVVKPNPLPPPPAPSPSPSSPTTNAR
jgi:hypothetical protein